MQPTEPMQTFTHGIYDGVPLSVYQNASGITHRDLSLYGRAPARSAASLAHSNPAPRNGDIFAPLLRLAILHPDAFGNGISHSLRSKEHHHRGARVPASESACAGLPVLTEAEAAYILAARDAVRAHPAARPLLTAPGESGVSIFGCHPATGLTLRARLDRLVEDAQECPWIIEIMPCADVHRFARYARELRADVQSAFTVDVLALAGLPDAVFVFIAVEAPPSRGVPGAACVPPVLSVPSVPSVPSRPRRHAGLYHLGKRPRRLRARAHSPCPVRSRWRLACVFRRDRVHRSLIRQKTVAKSRFADHYRRMSTLTIELPARQDQTEFNLRRWAELLADTELGRQLAKIEGRIETDRHGHIIMFPPAAFSHGSYQCEIAVLLKNLLPKGRVITECPISTADGVRVADVAWISQSRLKAIGENICLTMAPEICVEVISPDNTRAEMQEKKALYFAAGAEEVWFCDRAGKMSFHGDTDSGAAAASLRCPEFPRHIVL